MRSVLAYILLLALGFSILSKSFIGFNYFLNLDYYTSVLCSNKDNPALHCNGKCHLKKEMQKDEQKKSIPSGQVKTGGEVSFFIENMVLAQYQTSECEKQEPLQFDTKLLAGFGVSLFHPPC